MILPDAPGNIRQMVYCAATICNMKCTTSNFDTDVTFLQEIKEYLDLRLQEMNPRLDRLEAQALRARGSVSSTATLAAATGTIAGQVTSSESSSVFRGGGLFHKSYSPL